MGQGYFVIRETTAGISIESFADMTSAYQNASARGCVVAIFCGVSLFDDYRKNYENKNKESCECRWELTGKLNRNDVWDSDCGESFALDEGTTPLENGITFCQSCGKRIVMNTTDSYHNHPSVVGKQLWP
jgi:hypothetical protein